VQEAKFDHIEASARASVGTERQYTIEHRLATRGTNHVVVCSGSQGAPPVLKIVPFEHHGYVRIRGPRIGPQPAAHFEPRKLRDDPIDKRPGRAVDQLALPFGEGPKTDTDIVM